MNERVRDRIVRHAECRITPDESLAPHTTFRIGGTAAIFVEPENTDELRKIVSLVRNEGAGLFLLGHGSNILVSDSGFDGVVIKPGGELNHITMRADAVCAGPGTRLLALTAFAAAHRLSGMEQLSGIPGSVGGGLYMNAGAYGREICETLIETDVLGPDNRVFTLAAGEIGFGYRSAPQLQDVIVLESRYRLIPGERDAIYGEMRRVWKLRRAKQPLDFPSAGSIFRRPPGDYAGRLIEEVGGKGMRIGGAMVSPKHAGMFINAGGATAADVAALVREIRCKVHERFGIMLETEVKPVGFEKDPFAITV